MAAALPVGLAPVHGQHVQPIDDRARSLRRDDGGRQRLGVGVGAGEDRHRLTRLKIGQFEHRAPGLGQFVIADRHAASPSTIRRKKSLDSATSALHHMRTY